MGQSFSHLGNYRSVWELRAGKAQGGGRALATLPGSSDDSHVTSSGTSGTENRNRDPRAQGKVNSPQCHPHGYLGPPSRRRVPGAPRPGHLPAPRLFLVLAKTVMGWGLRVGRVLPRFAQGQGPR